MSDTVVDPLEIIEVEEQDCEQTLLAPGSGHGLRQVVIEKRAIGEAGQRVVEGAVPKLVLQRLAFGDVAHAQHQSPNGGIPESIVHD
jgi:hypothetical protein